MVNFFILIFRYTSKYITGGDVKASGMKREKKWKNKNFNRRFKMKILGIDLGTTNSCMAILEAGKPAVIENEEGGRTTPSVVAITEKSDELVGQIAKRQAITNPENTVFSVKRFMGRKYSSDVIQSDKKLVPYKVTSAANGDVRINLAGADYSPQEISAKILSKLKRDAEAYLGEKITQAVITVPAYFDDSQRQATKDAGRIAGLEVLRIINEPTAASLAYGLDKKKSGKIAVYDLGGGTFDISILEIGGGVFEVKSTNGDTHLGGDDFDQKVIDYLLDEFKKLEGIDLKKDRMALQRLKEAAEKAKCELSTSAQTQINLPFLTADQNGPKHMNLTLTRAGLEQLTEDLVRKTIEPCRKAMADAGVTAGDIDEVVMVGGQTRMPMVIQRVKEFFSREPHRGVNPDEVVAMGAAIQAGVLKGEIRDLLLLDVTPLSLGIETLGNIFTKLIERNTTIPTRKSQVFSTAEDNQTSVTVHVLQGERPMAKDNKTLGMFELTGIPPAPRGTPQVEVTFDIDANGIVHVSAKDMGTGRSQAITIKSSSGLSESEIRKMVDEAKEHEFEDRQEKEVMELKNETSNFIYSVEKTVKENGEKIGSSERRELEIAIADAKEALKGDDADRIKRTGEKLKTLSHKIAESIYNNKNKGSAGDGQQKTAEQEQKSNGGNKDDVIDAEFTEEKDRNAS